MKPVITQAYGTPKGYQALDCLIHVKDVEIDTARASATGVFAAQTQDRVGDILEIGGIDTTQHRKNPIVLWCHGWDWGQNESGFPIGVTEDPATREYAVALFPERGVAMATTFFSQSSLLAEQVCKLVMERTVRAQSIGFREKRSERMYDDERYVGTHLLEVEMIETSWVPIPANPDAVRKTLSGELCGKAIHPAIKAALSPYSAPAPAWANGFTPPKGKRAMKDGTDEAFDSADQEAPPSPADYSDDEPDGLKTLRGLHKRYSQLKSFCDKEYARNLKGSQVVKELLEAHLAALETCHNHVRAAFDEEYAEDYAALDETVSEEDDDEKEEDLDEEMTDEEKAMYERLRKSEIVLKHRARVLNAGNEHMHSRR